MEKLEYSLTDINHYTKTGTKLGRAISSKLTGEKLKSIFNERGEFVFYWHRIPQYFIKAINFEPYFFSDRDGEKRSEDYKIFKAKNQEECFIAMAILNSSLAYWYWLNYSEGYHFGKHEVLDFPVNLKRMKNQVKASLIELVKSLMIDYKKNLIRKIRNQKNTCIEYEEFRPKLSKPIIDEIDRVLARHYGFTDEELDFIINYDIKYRMGRDSGGDD
jgi:hypothetical protein